MGGGLNQWEETGKLLQFRILHKILLMFSVPRSVLVQDDVTCFPRYRVLASKKKKTHIYISIIFFCHTLSFLPCFCFALTHTPHLHPKHFFRLSSFGEGGIQSEGKDLWHNSQTGNFPMSAGLVYKWRELPPPQGFPYWWALRENKKGDIGALNK